MQLAKLRARLKMFMLPIAMLCGWLFHEPVEAVQFLSPYMIFTMLLITFCRVDIKEFRISALTWKVVGFQLICCVVSYFVIAPFNPVLAQGSMLCFLCPTATAAPVITAMLGGSILTLVAISVLSNLLAAAVAPLMFTVVVGETGVNIDFLATFGTVMAKVGPMIVGPMALALLLRAVAPKVHRVIHDNQSISFYLWSVVLIIVVGRVTTFALAEPADCLPQMLLLALASGVICAIQFIVGRRLGRRHGDPVAGAQGLGQKNTLLAVWMALTFLDPISSIAPAAYIIWQNSFNSLQIWLKARRDSLNS